MFSSSKKAWRYTFNELIQLVNNHQNPKRNIIAERFKFYSKTRQPNETIANFVAELRRLSEHCDYGDSLDDMMRGLLVCGINYKRKQYRLLSEGYS